MLTLSSIQPALPVSIESDPYVPLTIEAEDTASDKHLIFLKDPSGRGLVEIVLSRLDGRIVRAVLVSKPEAQINGDFVDRTDEERNGWPRLEATRADQARVHDVDNIEQTLFFGEQGSVSFVKWSDVLPDLTVQCDRALFWFAGKRLIGFGADISAV